MEGLEFVVFAVYFCLIVGGGLATARANRIRVPLPDLVEEFGRALCMEPEPLGGHRWRFEGTLRGRPARIRIQRAGGDWSIGIELDLVLPPKARVRPESALQGEDPQVGDPGFDALIDLRGPADWLSAAFSAEARGLLRMVQAGQGYTLGKGELRHTLSAVLEDLAAAAAAVDRTARLAELLSVSQADIPGRLLANATEDPVPSVRRTAAIRLLSLHPGTKAAAALAGNLGDDPELLALAALTTAPAEAAARLIPLLSSTDELVLDGAITALRAHGTVDAVPALREAARGSQRRNAEAAIAAIQARVGPVEAGRLAVAPEAAADGALSLQDPGTLALVEPPERR